MKLLKVIKKVTGVCVDLHGVHEISFEGVYIWPLKYLGRDKFHVRKPGFLLALF